MRHYNAAHPRISPSERIIGIDGEGVGRRPHRYTLLAGADELGETWSVAAEVGSAGRLSTRQCLDFALSLPGRSLIVSYAFLYDLTKWLEDLPERSLYLLFHEGRRVSRTRSTWTPSPIQWPDETKETRPEYSINLMNRRFSVGRIIYPEGKPKVVNRRTIWDIFAFFQSRFTKALLDWEVASKDKLERMERMKALRAEFDKQSPEEIHAYCQEECLYLAKLARRLIDAHKDAGLKLRNYYGAGSTASALLERMDVRSSRGVWPDEMRHAVACGFFGGRFENSFVGPVVGPVYSYDISSAYPYEACLLPCLCHGRWRFALAPTRGQLDKSTLALVRWIIGPIKSSPWGYLPVRGKKGTIVFPLSGQGGWSWKKEFLAAQRLNPDVVAREAWIYETNCDCRPFADLASVYRERCRIGKDAKGIVLKLGPNSVYGKLAQSKGINPRFQEWVWAGNITSGTRAKLLDCLSAATDMRNVVMFATDGVASTEKLTLPAPIDTETNDVIDSKTNKPKPLGGWEEKVYEKGIFLVRPGVYFPIEPSEQEIEKVRARGLGRKVVYDQWKRIVEAFAAGQSKVTVTKIQRFVGAKTGVTYGPKSGFKRSVNYGEWIEHSVDLTFSPIPKRRAVLEGGALDPWPSAPESYPYKNALRSPEAKLLQLAETIAEEQPDSDFIELQ